VIHIALSASHTHPAKTSVVSWKDLIGDLATVKAGRKEGDGWVAAQIPDGARTNDRVISTSLLVFDIDNKGSTVTQAELERAIRAKGYRAILHSTYNHTPDNPRFRLILDISEPIQPADHKSLLLYVAQNLGVSDFIDTACSDLSRYFYLPRCPIERVEDYVFWSVDGDPINVEACLDRIKLSRDSLAQRPLVKKTSDIEGWEESDCNIAKVKEFLSYCPADCEYGKWRSIVWSICSLNWEIGPHLIEEWSRSSKRHWGVR
jgi:hypothetical protein